MRSGCPGTGELARGQIAGDSYGMLKLLGLDRGSAPCSGVHIFGTNATEMVHIGQAVMGCGGTVRIPGGRGFQLPDVLRGLQGAPRST